MLDQEFIKMLADPETKEPLELAGQELVDAINQKIAAGLLENRIGKKITEKIDAGLVSKTNPQWLYPVRDEIPVMLTEEAIAL